MIKGNLGEHNGMWKGCEVKYTGLHCWVRRNLPCVFVCEGCFKDKRLDVACVTGLYSRDLINWKWLCRSCHMKLDFKMGRRKMIPWNKGKIIGKYSDERVQQMVKGRWRK